MSDHATEPALSLATRVSSLSSVHEEPVVAGRRSNEEHDDDHQDKDISPTNLLLIDEAASNQRANSDRNDLSEYYLEPSSPSRTAQRGATATPNGSGLYQNRQHQHRLSGVKRIPTRGPIQNPVGGSAAILCGIAAGVAQAGLFNPYDRALYLSVKDHKSFLSPSNWTSPYAGFWQSLGGRAVAGGLYYPLEHYFLRLLNRPGESWPLANFVSGVAAGACNALVTNPITVVKYRTWSRGEQSRGWWSEAAYVFRNSGGSPRPFFNGLAPTLMRDVVFGGVYTGCRLQIQWYADLSPDRQWQGNLVAAGWATVLASPFNYARNIQYATSSRQSQPSTAAVLRHLATEVMDADTSSSRLLRWRLLQQRLRIGWGTLRVALGMSFAHSVYDALHKQTRPYA